VRATDNYDFHKHAVPLKKQQEIKKQTVPSYQILVLKTDFSICKAVLAEFPFLNMKQRTFALETTDNGSFRMDQTPLSTARRLNHHLFRSLTAGIKMHSLVARQPSKLFNTVYILHHTSGTTENKSVNPNTTGWQGI
jgi:hypothetical protein